MKKIGLLSLIFTLFLISNVSALTLITNCTDLQGIPNGTTETYQLTNNIDCSDTINWNGGTGFNPIFDFNGTLDGQGYNITNFWIQRGEEGAGNSEGNRQALFGSSFGNFIIKNIGMVNVSINASQNVGGFISASYNQDSFINNTWVTGKIIIYGNGGGIAGTNYGLVENSYVISNIILDFGNGASYTGGLIGETGATTIIRNSYFKGNITGGDYGIGGLVGYHAGFIDNSYSIVLINSTEEIGGLVGGLDSAGNIYNSFSQGFVYSVGNPFSLGVGGLVGTQYGGNITNSYSTTFVDGSITGGLVGLEDTVGTCENSFWDTETSGQATSGCGTGKTTAQMQTEGTYTNWDFINTWQIADNEYPTLQIFGLIQEQVIEESQPQYTQSPVYQTLQSGGSGIAVFMQFLTSSLPSIILGLAVVMIMIAIGSAIVMAVKGKLR